MALFDKIGEMAKNVGDKTGDMIEVSKLNSQVSEADKRILEKKREIGEFCWGQYIANIQLDPEVAKLCAAIKEDEALIARMQADIRSIKADKAAAPVVVEAGLLRCQKCGEPNPEGTRFCQACGVRLEVPEPAPPGDAGDVPGLWFSKSRRHWLLPGVWKGYGRGTDGFRAAGGRNAVGGGRAGRQDLPELWCCQQRGQPLLPRVREHTGRTGTAGSRAGCRTCLSCLRDREFFRSQILRRMRYEIGGMICGDL